MKKKYLALLLAVVLAVGLLPGTVFAADYTYTEAIPCIYDEVKPFSEGLAAVKLDDKWGFIDKEGNVVIPFQYDNANSFSEGLAAVSVITGQDKFGAIHSWGYIDQTGMEVVPIQYDEAAAFSEGLALVGVAYSRNRAFRFSFPCDYGYIDQTGQMIIPIQYRDVAGSFSEGLALVPTLNGEKGYIDKAGQMVFTHQYASADAFTEGLAVVHDENYNWGYIDKEGNEVVPLQYTYALAFSEGLAAVRIGNALTVKWGYIDKEGNEVIPLQYDYVSSFSEGLAAVRTGSKWGFIDQTGKEVIPCQYRQAQDFSEGLAAVQIDLYGKWGYIDKEGNVVVPLQYDDAKMAGLTADINFHEGMAAVHMGDYNGGKWGFISISGTSELKPTEPELPTKFTDVPAGAYYADAVNWAVDEGITSGTGNGTTFSPNKPCTRGQIVTFLWRAYGEQEPTITENPFTDVKPSDYYYKAVLWAVEKGITQGTSATTFSPSGTCTRDQAVTFQWRAAGRPAVSGGSSFTDVDSTAYYADAVAWAVANSITQGTSTTTFNPGGICDRGQIVTFLYREMGQSPTPTPTPTPGPTGGNSSSRINFTISGGNYSNVDEPPVVMTWDLLEGVEKQVSLNGCYVLSPEAQLTVSNLANADDNCYTRIYLYLLMENDGPYYIDEIYYSCLTNNGGFIPTMDNIESPDYGGVVQLRPGDSVTFSLAGYEIIRDYTGEEHGTYGLLVLSAHLYYPDFGQSWRTYYGFVIE